MPQSHVVLVPISGFISVMVYIIFYFEVEQFVHWNVQILFLIILLGVCRCDLQLTVHKGGLPQQNLL